MKKCNKCGVEKELGEFWKDSRVKDGHRGRCKSCINHYRAQNKEKFIEKSRQYYSQNKEAVKERSRKNYAQNKERVKKRTRENYVRSIEEQPNCVYQIKNKINKKVYIGQTIRGRFRCREHLYRLRGNYHNNKVLQEDFDKFGEKAFEWSILKEIENEDCNALLLEEARSIKQHIDEGVELYNISLTEEQLKILSENQET